jgi:arylsulfatase A
MRFVNAHATPLCTPSRVELLTGRYNHRNYVRFGQFDFRERTFAHSLKQAGYATAIAGKWQLEGGKDGPHQAGFDEYLLWQISAQQRGSRYWDPRLMRNGVEVKGTEGRYGPDLFLEFLQDFTTRNRERPFLAYWPMVLTHDPFDPTPAGGKRDRPSGPEHFPDMVAYLDTLVGKLTAHLDALGVRENTLILFTGDNGTGRPIESRLNGRPFRGGKGFTTDAGTHVPLIVNRPGFVPAGRVNRDLVDFTDVLPTLAAATGAPLPAGVELDGRSFLPQLKGEAGAPRDALFLHYEPRNGRNNSRTRLARDTRWKLYDDGRLFDVQADPDEQRALLADGDSPEAAAARARLAALLARMKPTAAPPADR